MNKKFSRMRRATNTRRHLAKLNATRLVIYRSARHIYAQVILPNASVVTTASTLEKNISRDLNYTGNIVAASAVGKVIAQRTLKKGIKSVSFDRSGFKYHGRIQALADSARRAGLCF